VDQFGVLFLSEGVPLGREYCRIAAPLPTLPITSGNIVVTDAQPAPTSTQQCKNSGWRQYGVFKNQGDCVSFVATGGRNQPANPPT
jgi:hypothetical protein